MYKGVKGGHWRRGWCMMHDNQLRKQEHRDGEIDSFLWSVAADVDGNTMENGRPVVLPEGLLRRSRILGGDIGILTHFGGVEEDAADIDHDVVPRWERVLFSHRRHQKIVRKIRRRDKFDITVAHCPYRRD